MFPDQVIYTASADLTVLNAILNAIAMICQEHATIWGFALVAATWSLVSMTTVASVGAAAGGASADLSKRALGLLIPFCLAIFLTNGAMKSTVTVESGLTGVTTSVDNVPVLISFVPATASLVSKIVGEKLETALQGTGTDYGSLSATHQGFINPLKTLLTSRTAILRLGGVASKVNSLLSACLNSDSGADYAAVARHVMFAGNLATNPGPTSISVWSGVGSHRTSIGVLLAEAAQNTSAIVTDIPVGTYHVATCADAAAQVAADIDQALGEPEFKRVVQGAVNAADQPNAAGDFSINAVATAYSAVRTANSVTGGLAGGVSQANAETINLLFSELIKNDLECLRADGSNKSTCLAMVVQANEIERNNIQAAANGFESLMYAGAFANQITAVVIGLGPVIVLFMMWSGVGAARHMKVAAHMIVWPLLIMNIGAELINGMTYISIANFLRTISQGGVIDHSTAVEVYKNFSLEIGTASHLMATLPILMSTIFALGESAALVRISDSMASGSKDESKSVNPPPVDSAPLVTNSSVAKAEQGIGGADLSLTGAIPAVTSSAQFGSIQREAANSITSAHQKMHTLSEGTSNLQDWKEALSTGNFRKVGVSESTGKALRDAFNRNYNATQTGKAGQEIGVTNDNFNNTQAAFSVGAEVGAGVTGLAAGISGGGDLRAMTGANDTTSATKHAGQDSSIAVSNSLSKAFDSFMQSDNYKNLGTEEARSLQRSAGIQKQYVDTLAESRSASDIASEAVKHSSGLVAMSARIGGAEFLNQMKTSTAFRQFQLNQGRAFGSSAAAQPYLDQARHDIHAGVTDRLTGDTQANEAMARHRAAVLMATDEHASPEDRLAANEYLLGTTHAMLAARFSSASIRPPNTTSIGAPANRTGVDAGALVRKADSAAKASMSGRGGTQRAGVATESLARSGQEFATAVAGDVTSVANSVHGARQGAEELGTTAGLTGAQEADTRGRTRASVASNLQETLPEFLRPQKASNRPAQGQSESGDMEPASTARAGGGDGNTSPVLQTNSNEDLRKADIRLPAGARFFVQPEELDAAAAVSDSTATADSGAPSEIGDDEAKGLTSAQTDHASNADHAHGSGAGDEVQTSRSEGHGIAVGSFAGSAQEDRKQPRTMEDSESAFAGDEASSEAAGALAARDGVDYAMAGSEPQMAHTAQSGGHYYLPLLIGKMVGLSPERVRTIAAYSQFPDQVSALDGYTNGVRRTFSPSAYEAAQVGEFSERAIHALNGRTTIENLAFYQREIVKYRNDDARVGIAMHGLVDSIFHSRPVNGVNVTYGAPLGHGLHGSDPDYISEEQAKAAAGQLMRAFETVSGVKLNDGQRAQVMTTVNQALTRARALTDGEAKAFHEGELRYGHGSGGRPPKQNERMEINFRRAVTEMMGPTMPILSPPENLPSPFWRGQITPAGSVEETKQFIGGSQAVAGGFAERGMEAAGDIMRDFARTSPGFLKYQNLYVNKLYDTQAWSLKDVIPGYLAAPHTRPF